MIKFNEKYTKEEVELLTMKMAILSCVSASKAPQTQEEFDAWCEETLEKDRVVKEKEVKRKENREKRLAEPGYKTRLAWQRRKKTIKSAKDIIKKYQAILARAERELEELAEQYEKETGKKLEK